VLKDAPVQCSFELVRNGAVVATGKLTLPHPPQVGDPIEVGGVDATISQILPGPRLRLVA
jgi:hypothetical protein